MDFDAFFDVLPKIENLPLPGVASHYKMMPMDRIEGLKRMKLERKNAKKAAVLALLYPDKTYQTRMLFILRKTYQGVHSNQIGFPGGKAEPGDAHLGATALRETQEEVGVDPQQVTLTKALTQVYIPPSNFEVQPFLGTVTHTPEFVLQESEVEALVEVKLSDIMDDRNASLQKVFTSYSKSKIGVPAYRLNGHIVWGATAMMLGEIKDLLKQVL